MSESTAAESKADVPRTLQELDFRDLSLEEPAAVLRAWARGLAGELLGADAPSVDPRSLETLSPFVHIRTGRRRDRRWVLRPLRYGGRKARFEHLTSWIIASHLRQSKRRFVRVWSWRRPRRIMPSSLWPVLGETAWREPRFEHWLSGAVGGYLRRQFLVSGGQLPRPVIRPQAWWFLFELIALPALHRPSKSKWSRGLRRWIPGALRRWWFARGRLGRLRRRLSWIAQQQSIYTPGWAGFWEQWLIGEACLLHAELVRRAPERSRLALGVLPVLESPRYQEMFDQLTGRLLPEERAAEARQFLVDAGWKSQKPAWLELVEVSRKPQTAQEGGSSPGEQGRISSPEVYSKGGIELARGEPR